MRRARWGALIAGIAIILVAPPLAADDREPRTAPAARDETASRPRPAGALRPVASTAPRAPRELHHEGLLARIRRTDPGRFDGREALLEAMGPPPSEPGASGFRYEGVHRFAYRTARHYYRKTMRRQARERFELSSGGEALLEYERELAVGDRVLYEHERGGQAPSFEEAFVDAPRAPPRPPVTVVGSEVQILGVGPLHLRNDLRVRYDALEVELFDFLRGDDPVEDWVERRDAAPPRPLEYEARGEPVEDVLDGRRPLPPARRQLVPPGNLYDNDRVTVSGKVRIRLRRRSDVLDAIASSVGLRVRAVVFGGADHRPMFDVTFKVRPTAHDEVTLTLTIAVLSF